MSRHLRLYAPTPHTRARGRWIATNDGAYGDREVEVIDCEDVIRVGRINAVEYRRRPYRRFWFFRRERVERRVHVVFDFVERKAEAGGMSTTDGLGAQ